MYSRNAPDVRTRRKLMTRETESNLKTSWESTDKEEPPKELKSEYQPKKQHMKIINKLLIFSAIFCVFAVGVGAFLFFNGGNMISTANIDISVDGPVSISGGDPVTFEVVIRNNNSIDLELVDLTVDFPPGTSDPDNSTKELNNYRKMVGTIPAKSSIRESVSAIIFGEENVQKEMVVGIAFSVKGSTSVFTRKYPHSVLIKSSPINVNVTSFKEVTSGQEFEVKVELKSNSPQVLKNILLKADYPFGYELLSSSIPSLSDKQTWKIGDIPPGASKNVTLKGKIMGENNESREFKFTVGSASTQNPNVIGTPYMSSQFGLTIEKPFVSLGVAIDNDSGPKAHVGEFGKPQRIEIEYFNNLAVAVSNLTITALISGNAYDPSTVQPRDGNFESGKNMITWNARTNSELATVGPGESGTVSFSVVPVDRSGSGAPIVNPKIEYKINVAGRRAQEANVPQNITSAAERESRIVSAVSLSGRIVRTTGPFASQNTGPIPPKADTATTYTVIWSVDNTANNVTNARVTSSLPPYVKWLGNISPATENISFDEATGIISWNVGNVSTYTLKNSKRREVAFQISFTPNITQVNQSPTLVSRATLQSLDSFTGVTLESEQDFLNTRFSTDPGFREGDQEVKQ